MPGYFASYARSAICQYAQHFPASLPCQPPICLHRAAKSASGTAVSAVDAPSFTNHPGPTTGTGRLHGQNTARFHICPPRTAFCQRPKAPQSPFQNQRLSMRSASGCRSGADGNATRHRCLVAGWHHCRLPLWAVLFFDTDFRRQRLQPGNADTTAAWRTSGQSPFLSYRRGSDLAFTRAAEARFQIMASYTFSCCPSRTGNIAAAAGNNQISAHCERSRLTIPVAR